MGPTTAMERNSLPKTYASFVTLGKALYLSGLQIPHLWLLDNNFT